MLHFWITTNDIQAVTKGIGYLSISQDNLVCCASQSITLTIMNSSIFYR